MLLRSSRLEILIIFKFLDVPAQQSLELVADHRFWLLLARSVLSMALVDGGRLLLRNEVVRGLLLLHVSVGLA